MPSVSELKARFACFGQIHSAHRVFWKSAKCQFVFKYESDAKAAYKSRAISKYLASKHKDIGTDLLRSGCLKESAIVETWMEVEAHQFNAPMRTLIHQLILSPLGGSVPDEKIIDTELEKLGKVLDVYEQKLSVTKYLAVDFYSMAISFLLHENS
ncbi:hypothetical protein Q3G72_001767 [Acer saccharum]|nr:hypothetical protein Q3G72_001767 [Acer saccharum]